MPVVKSVVAYHSVAKSNYEEGDGQNITRPFRLVPSVSVLNVSNELPDKIHGKKKQIKVLTRYTQRNTLMVLTRYTQRNTFMV